MTASDLIFFGVLLVGLGLILRDVANNRKRLQEPPRKYSKCGLCKHNLVDNKHGIDSNDVYLDDKGILHHYGICSYCNICDPYLGI